MILKITAKCNKALQRKKFASLVIFSKYLVSIPEQTPIFKI